MSSSHHAATTFKSDMLMLASRERAVTRSWRFPAATGAAASPAAAAKAMEDIDTTCSSVDRVLTTFGFKDVEAATMGLASRVLLHEALDAGMSRLQLLVVRLSGEDIRAAGAVSSPMVSPSARAPTPSPSAAPGRDGAVLAHTSSRLPSFVALLDRVLQWRQAAVKEAAAVGAAPRSPLAPLSPPPAAAPPREASGSGSGRSESSEGCTVASRVDRPTCGVACQTDGAPDSGPEVSALRRAAAAAEARVVAMQADHAQALTRAHADVAQLQQQLDACTAAAHDAQQQADAAAAAVEAARGHQTEAEQRAAGLEARVQAADASVAALQQQLSDAGARATAAERRSDDLQAAVDRLQQVLDEAAAVGVQALDEAAAVGVQAAAAAVGGDDGADSAEPPHWPTLVELPSASPPPPPPPPLSPVAATGGVGAIPATVTAAVAGGSVAGTLQARVSELEAALSDATAVAAAAEDRAVALQGQVSAAADDQRHAMDRERAGHAARVTELEAALEAARRLADIERIARAEAETAASAAHNQVTALQGQLMSARAAAEAAEARLTAAKPAMELGNSARGLQDAVAEVSRRADDAVAEATTLKAANRELKSKVTAAEAQLARFMSMDDDSYEAVLVGELKMMRAAYEERLRDVGEQLAEAHAQLRSHTSGSAALRHQLSAMRGLRRGR